MRIAAGILIAVIIALILGCATPPVTAPPAPSPSTTQTTKTNIFTDGKMIVRGSGEPVELINNPNATNPTFAELVAFLERDRTDQYAYIVGPPENAFVCSDFAETVHNNAEAAGIRAVWVGIDIEGETEGHALNAFETTDLGLVYIDCTGKGLRDDEHPSPLGWDRRARVEMGEPYALAKMGSAASEFWFYISSDPMRNSLGLTYPSVWGIFAGETVEERQLKSEKRLEWHRTHKIQAVLQEWMHEWLLKYAAELSKSGRVNEPAEASHYKSFWGSEGYRTHEEWIVFMLDSNETPWFQEQVLVKEEYMGGPNWRGFKEFEILPPDAKVEQKIIEVDGLPIAWEIGWRDKVRDWFRPFGDEVVKSIHMY